MNQVMMMQCMQDEVVILDAMGHHDHHRHNTITRRRVVNHRSSMVNHDVSLNVAGRPWSRVDNDAAILFDIGHYNNMVSSMATRRRVNHAIDQNSSNSDCDSMCCICLGDLFTGLTPIRMPQRCCNHVFHRDCIQKWLNVNRTCPLCRAKV